MACFLSAFRNSSDVSSISLPNFDFSLNGDADMELFWELSTEVCSTGAKPLGGYYCNHSFLVDFFCYHVVLSKLILGI